MYSGATSAEKSHVNTFETVVENEPLVDYDLITEDEHQLVAEQ